MCDNVSQYKESKEDTCQQEECLDQHGGTSSINVEEEGPYCEKRLLFNGESVVSLYNKETGLHWFLRGECDGIANELNRGGRPFTTREILQQANDWERETKKRELSDLTRGWPTKEDKVRLEPRINPYEERFVPTYEDIPPFKGFRGELPKSIVEPRRERPYLNSEWK